MTLSSIAVQPLHTSGTGLVPGGAPTALSGGLDNATSNSVYVTSVTVTILAVTKAVGAAAGACNASDYAITDATMAVNGALGAHSKILFGGASIVFVDKATVNQDACKLSTVTLSYTAI